MPNTWIKRTLRGTPVYARCRPDGTPLADESGRVDVIYKLDAGAKLYRAAAGNLSEVPGEKPVELEHAGEAAPAKNGGAKTEALARRPASGVPARMTPPPDAVVVYTDGACTGNPGPMGIGVVVLMDETRKELSLYLGEGTNNIAELTAIEKGLELVESLGPDTRARPVWVHSDSSYALGLLGKGWKAKANQQLVERLRVRAKRFPRVEWIKVAGHAGVPENERCDQLAREAIARRR
jgi:ribonuclease HI